MQQVVRLLGDLGERYGTEHTYHNLRSPADAIKLLCVNYPALQKELVEAHLHGVEYRVIQAGVDLSEHDLRLPLGKNDLVITPVIAGSGSTGRTILGIALIAASIVFAPVAGGKAAGFLGLTGSGGLTATQSVILGRLGVALVLGGVSEMLSPQPTLTPLAGGDRMKPTRTDGPQSVTRGADGTQTYAYTGAANTVGLGATIPVAYGEVLVGSHLLSATVEVSDESDPLKNTIKQPGAETVLFGGEKLTSKFTTSSGVVAKRTDKKSFGNNAVQKPINQVITLEDGKEQSLGTISYNDKFFKKVDVVLELDKGLFEFVSGEGTTKVDGFITYKIEVIGTPQGGNEQVVGNSQATIQGLLLDTQKYRWMHRLNMSDVTYTGNIEYRVTVIDFRAEQTTTLVARAYGFNLDRSIDIDDGGEDPAVSTVDINGTTLSNTFKSVGGTLLKLTSANITSSQESSSIERVYALVVSSGTRFRKTASLSDAPNANLDIIFEITDGLAKKKSGTNALFPGSITISNEVTIKEDGESDVVKTSTFKITGTLRKGQKYKFVQRVRVDNFSSVNKVVVAPVLIDRDTSSNDHNVRFVGAGFNLNP
jgi:predicted phage tail protein|tara:strand:- start:3351 stop:5132 length:1782 start_codon:yes stop_codon:yes gene_type:complete